MSASLQDFFNYWERKTETILTESTIAGILAGICVIVSLKTATVFILTPIAIFCAGMIGILYEKYRLIFHISELEKARQNSVDLIAPSLIESISKFNFFAGYFFVLAVTLISSSIFFKWLPESQVLIGLAIVFACYQFFLNQSVSDNFWHLKQQLCHKEEEEEHKPMLSNELKQLQKEKTAPVEYNFKFSDLFTLESIAISLLLFAVFLTLKFGVTQLMLG